MMLGLGTTELLVDALRPPAGMELAAAVGTTFTLDLASLLAIPVAAAFDASTVDEMGAGESDGAALLETIRRYGDATILFCQAGAIAVPRRYRAAHTFVEQSVVEVKKPKGGIFHPKMWVVRFEGGGQKHHRVLVMSRNLTFDRALDVIVRLDEEPSTSRAVDATAVVSMLETFLDDSVLVRPLDSRQRTLVGNLRASLDEARLAVPSPFLKGRVLVGMPGARRYPFHQRCDRALAVSPFLTADAVQRLGGSAKRSVLVSRGSEMDRLGYGVTAFEKRFKVRSALIDAQEFAEGGGDTEVDGDTADVPDLEAAARGLHAKVFVQDVGARATAWLGSANLTTPGFSSNYEVQVELEGHKRDVGVDQFLDPAGERRDLSRLIEQHPLPEDAVESEAVDDEGMDALTGALFELASTRLDLYVTPDVDRWGAEVRGPLAVADGITCWVRPLTLTDFQLVGADALIWSGLDITAITPFVVLEVRSGKERRATVVRAELHGDPADRSSAVMAHTIRSQEDFLRYLAAMLGFHIGDAPGNEGGGPGAGGSWIGGLRADRVLEDLLTTAARKPARLDALNATLRQLCGDESTRAFVPAEFMTLWDAVWGSRKAWSK